MAPHHIDDGPKRFEGHLSLSDSERPTTRYFATQVSREQLQQARTGTLPLEIDDENRRFWSQCLQGDLILLVCIPERLIGGCLIANKSITVKNNPIHAASRRFLVGLEFLGSGELRQLPWGVFFETSTKFQVLSHAQFEPLWSLCRPATPTGVKPSSFGRISLSSDGLYEVRFAYCRKDYQFIRQISVHHPFGIAVAPITLIATQQGTRVGALLGDYSSASDRRHPAPWRLFGARYADLRRSALRYVRLYNDPAAKAKIRIHEALARAFEQIAPSLLNQPISLIESISYDYHPIAPRLGYRVEFPTHPDATFYYFKPFWLPDADDVKAPLDQEDRKSLKRLLAKRRTRMYWLASGSGDDIERAFEKKVWALRYGGKNNANWHRLKSDEIIFIKDRSDHTRWFGIVEGTKIHRMQGREQFPLWISFSQVVGLDCLDIAQYIADNWKVGARAAGLQPLPQAFGAALKRAFCDQVEGNSMWVQPNPYLLHRNDVEVRPGYVFVIQAFDLSNTVFPFVKTLLEPHGYTARFSGDRSGQVIFEDIWLLLNEAEVVLVDFTLKRPNVYLEFGMALVLGKPVVAITQNKDDLPSDTPELKYILYSDKLGDNVLVKELPRAIRDTVEDIHRLRRPPPGSELRDHGM